MSTFECPLQTRASDSPQKIAVFDGKSAWTWRDWNVFVNCISNHLAKKNFSKGQRVVLLSSGTFHMLSVLIALWRWKIIVCPLNPKITDIQKDSLHDALDWAECWDHDDIVGLCEESLHEKETFVSEPWSTEDWATILLSSGTSSLPKQVLLDHGCHLYSAKAVEQSLALCENSLWTLSLPIYHIGGFSIFCRTLYTRMSLKIVKTWKDWSSVFSNGVTHVSLVPTQFRKLLAEDEACFFAKQCSAIVLGGAMLHRSVLKEAEARKIPIVISYGSTETASQIFTSRSHKAIFSLKEDKSPFVDILIDKENQILVKGEVLFCGYWTKNTVKSPLTKEGWYPTGDLISWIDEKRELFFIKGRKDRMIVSGGENIYPEEIEKILMRVEGVLRAKVVPHQDKRFGQRFSVYIDSHEEWSADVLKQHLSDHLEKFKIPDAFYPWKEDLYKGKE